MGRALFFYSNPLLKRASSVEIQTASKLEVGVESLILGLGTLCLTLGEFLMKKTLIALAAVAAVGAASAQVTLYGKMDLGVYASSGSVGGVASVDQFKAGENNISNSRWGMKGSEDLGGGMTASFTLEGKITAGTGAAGTNLFDRNSQLNLSGGFGTISMGRMYTAYDNALGYTDAQGYHNMAAINILAGGAHGDAGRTNNSISYTTPAMNGFQVQVQTAPGADATTTASASGYNALWMSYMSGPLGLHYAYESTAAAGGAQVVSNAVGANYNMGVATLSLLAENGSSALGAQDSGYALSVAVPMGSYSVNAGYAREATSNLTASNGTRSAYSVTGVYPLSKRSNIYAAYYSSSSTVDSTTVETKSSKFALGMRHDF